MMPFASASGQATDPFTAIFTSISSVCVVGIGIVSFETHWSGWGKLIVLFLAQSGGLGVMTLATILTLFISDRLGNRLGLIALTETKGAGAGELRRIMLNITRTALTLELFTGILLTIRLATNYNFSVREAVWSGFFHSISSFNNAGISLYDDSLARFEHDTLMLAPISINIVLGAVGFPVLLELSRQFSRRRALRKQQVRRSLSTGTPVASTHSSALVRRPITLHTKVTVATFASLLLAGWIIFTLTEWTNPNTLGNMTWWEKFLSGGFYSVALRTAGFSTMDISSLEQQTMLLTDLFMMIGGGSAGTAGGIKVATFAVVVAIIWTEISGENSVHMMRRKLSSAVQRQALTVVVIAVGVVFLGTLTVSATTYHNLDRVVFEVIAAFSTVGLSTGVTEELPMHGQVIMMVLMVIGRLGPITLASSLALRERPRKYDYPQDRVIVG